MTSGTFLFCCSQLFGEEDPDQDVSPDTEDPEAAGDAGEAALAAEAKADTVGGIERKSTRQWAVESGYHAQKLFTKVRSVHYIHLFLKMTFSFCIKL